MRALSRIAVILVGSLVLITAVPYLSGLRTARSEDLGSSPLYNIPSNPQPEIVQPPAPRIVEPEVAPAIKTPALAPFGAASARAANTPVVLQAQSAPGAAPVPMPADDLMVELKLARRTVSAKPYPVPTGPVENFEVFVHLPPTAAQRAPLRVLLILHGMGGRGDRFAQPFIAEADRNNWVIIAPNLNYTRDYMDPAQLVEEDVYLGHSLHAMLDALPGRLGIKLRQHALIFGFSRGAQLATRFALFHPDYVETVAAVSGGSYTLPVNNGDDKQVARFPFGVGDLKQKLGWSLDWDRFKCISFWVAVGGKDNRPAEVARAFDPYIGRTRVERAQKFEAALAKLGIDAHLVIFQNADHEVTEEMRNGAVKFLRQDELADHLDD